MTPRKLSNGYRDNNGNIYNMIFLSLIIHVIVITVLLISIPTASRHLTFGAAYSVSLVGSADPGPANDASGLQDILQQNEAAHSIILKSKITSIYSTPVKNQETHKLNIEKAVSAIRKKDLRQSESHRGLHPLPAGRQYQMLKSTRKQMNIWRLSNQE